MSKELLRKAEEYCAQHKLRFTDPRREVLRIIAAAKKPLGAYDVLELLGKSIDNPKPPTAYRAIEFWQEQGFVHRIESLNAYVSCEAGHRHSGSQFLICDSCGSVTETHICTLPEAFQKLVSENSFEAGKWNLEIHGQCSHCHH